MEQRRQWRRNMSVLPPTGINWVEAMQPLEARRRAQVIASFAEYLAEDVDGNPSRALEAVASLAEWCEGDRRLMARAPMCCGTRSRRRTNQTRRRPAAGS